MQFIMKVNMNNAAFEESSGDEVCRILDKVSIFVEGSDLSVGDGYSVYDINGNTVGRWDIVAD
jgi:hypothetical protein